MTAFTPISPKEAAELMDAAGVFGVPEVLADFAVGGVARPMGDDELQAVVDIIAANPEAGDIMPGCGGARKLRVARPAAASRAATGW